MIDIRIVLTLGILFGLLLGAVLWYGRNALADRAGRTTKDKDGQS